MKKRTSNAQQQNVNNQLQRALDENKHGAYLRWAQYGGYLVGYWCEFSSCLNAHSWLFSVSQNFLKQLIFRIVIYRFTFGLIRPDYPTRVQVPPSRFILEQDGSDFNHEQEQSLHSWPDYIDPIQVPVSEHARDRWFYIYERICFQSGWNTWGFARQGGHTRPISLC